jgi:hypothetical protein
MIVGIDFSINSTAVCIKMGEKHHLFSYVPNYITGKTAFKIHDSLKGIVITQGYVKAPKAKDSIEEQYNKLLNADQLSDIIMMTFEYMGISQTDVQEIRIEGFSYGSKGNSFIDLITYNTFLKVKLIQKFGHIIKVVPPKTLKKAYTDNGNATKCDMLRTFLGKSNSRLSDKIREMNIVKEGEFNIPKPLDDLVDSIGLTEIWQ